MAKLPSGVPQVSGTSDTSRSRSARECPELPGCWYPGREAVPPAVVVPRLPGVRGLGLGPTGALCPGSSWSVSQPFLGVRSRCPPLPAPSGPSCPGRRRLRQEAPQPVLRLLLTQRSRCLGLPAVDGVVATHCYFMFP